LKRNEIIDHAYIGTKTLDVCFDEDSNYIYLDKNQTSYTSNGINVTTICFPVKKSRAFVCAETTLKNIGQSPDTLEYIEQSIKFDTSKNLCATYEFITYKDKYEQTILKQKIATNETTLGKIFSRSIEQRILTCAKVIFNSQEKEGSTSRKADECIDKKDETIPKGVKQTPNLSIDVIFNNPFRILGLLFNATEREITRQANDLKIYVEMGKTPKVEVEFPCFPACDRTSESIEEAKKKIEQSENRVLYSLFWYSNNGSVDELALDVLSEGKTEKAMELWEKALSKYMIDLDRAEKGVQLLTLKDFSYAKNLMVLYLGLAFKENKINYAYFRKSLYLAGMVFRSSEPLRRYAALIVGSHYKHDKGEAIAKFYIDGILKCVKPLLDNSLYKANLKEIAASFSLFPDEFRQYANCRKTWTYTFFK
jgi:tetratricopeptide (TPR) repeat protein